jgi:hypothetical protein
LTLPDGLGMNSCKKVKSNDTIRHRDDISPFP